MVLIGVDPHKGSHMAVAVDGNEQVVGEIEVRADHRQAARLVEWAAAFPDRRFAVESAAGLGALLAQQLVAAGETVVDVPPTLAARVRLLGSERSSKNDRHDAYSVAVAALRQRGLRTVQAEGEREALRLLVARHRDLGRLRTQAACRLHDVLCRLTPGGLSGRLSVPKATALLERVQPANRVETERVYLARSLLEDVAHLDRGLRAARGRIVDAVKASRSGLTETTGVGPVIAALIIAHTGDVGRFASRHHYASYNGTAPREASSGPRVRHRLNLRGNRTLNHALHLVAVTQVRCGGEGRAYYERKLGEGKTRKEAMRALKRRISDAVYRQLVRDAACC